MVKAGLEPMLQTSHGEHKTHNEEKRHGKMLHKAIKVQTTNYALKTYGFTIHSNHQNTNKF